MEPLYTCVEAIGSPMNANVTRSRKSLLSENSERDFLQASKKNILKSLGGLTPTNVRS